MTKLSNIGYPITLCGAHDFNGKGCTECCYGQIVLTDKRNWDQINSSLTPGGLTKATGIAISRMENLSPGLTSRVIGAGDPQLRLLQAEYTYSFDRLNEPLNIDGRLLQYVYENQDAQLLQSLNAQESLGLTEQTQELLDRGALGTDIESESALIRILTAAVANRVQLVGHTFSMQEIYENVFYMIDPNTSAEELPCPFLNTVTAKCDIYKNRPRICQLTGQFDPEIPGSSGCGSNFLFSSLHMTDEQDCAGCRKQFELYNRNGEFYQPLEFLIVREMKKRNANFANNPINFLERPVKKHRRH